MKPDSTHRIGAFAVAIGFDKPSTEAKARFDRRAETLTAWLLARWEAEHGEDAHEHARAAG